MEIRSMVEYCNTVIENIKAAQTEPHLAEIIETSACKFEAASAVHRGTYIINMIVSLRASKAQSLTEQQKQNIDRAIELYREYGARYPDALF